MSTQITILNSYAKQLDGTVKINAKVLDKQIMLKNELIARRVRKETARSNGHGGAQPQPA